MIALSFFVCVGFVVVSFLISLFDEGYGRGGELDQGQLIPYFIYGISVLVI